jgi:hypothetical protein
VWHEGRAALALALLGRFRPRRPSSMSSRPGLAPRASTSSPPSAEQLTPTLRIGTSNPKSALGVGRDRRHGRARVVWPAGTRPRRLRPPAEHGLGSTAGRGLPLHELGDGGVELDEDGGGESRRVRGNRQPSPTRAQSWGLLARNARIRVASQPSFPSWDGNRRSSPSASPCCPPYSTAACSRAQSHHNRPIRRFHRAA